MTTPPDQIGFDLVPNDDGDDPARQAAVRAAIIAFAEAHGLTVVDEPGAIEPDANENEERAGKIRDDTNPRLVEATAGYHREEHLHEEELPDGTIRREVKSIVDARAHLGVSLKALHDLIDKCTYGIGTGWSLACKLVNWAREKIPSRKR